MLSASITPVGRVWPSTQNGGARIVWARSRDAERVVGTPIQRIRRAAEAINRLGGMRIDINEFADIIAVSDLDLVGKAIFARHAFHEAFAVDNQAGSCEPTVSRRLSLV